MFTPFAFLVPQFNLTSIATVSGPRLFLGGYFVSYKTPPANRIVKIQPNGVIDPTFNTATIGQAGTSGLTGTGYKLDIQPDGKIIVIYNGLFYAGSAAFRVLRVNSNGTWDSTYAISGGGFSNNPAYGLKCQSDLKTVFGGQFTTWNGSSVPRLIRVNSSGSRDTTLNVGAGPNSQVMDLDIQSDGKIVAVGFFTAYSGSTSNYIVRVNADGTRDTTFNVGTGLNSVGYVVKVASDGKIYVAGAFSAYSGSSSPSIIRLNSNGTRDTTFNVGTGFNSTVYGLDIQADSKVLVTGVFTTYSGSTSNYITRLNTNGTRDTTFNVGTGFNTARASFDSGQIEEASDGTIYVNGAFTTYSGSTVNGITRLNTNGTINTTFNNTDSATGYSTMNTNTNYGVFLKTIDNSVLSIGEFISYRDTPKSKIISLTPTGDVDSTFATGRGFNDYVIFSLDTQDGGVLLSGNLSTYNGSTVRGLVKLSSNGNIDSASFSSGLNSVTIQHGYNTGSQYMLTGNFTTYSGSTTNRIVRVNTNGSKDTNFNPGAGLNNLTYYITPQSDGKIIAGGVFTAYSGSAVNRIVRINTNGTRDTTFNVGTGFNSTVYAQVVQADGKIVVAGSFTTYSGSLSGHNRIIRLNTNGTKDATFNVGTGFNNNVFGMFPQSDGKIIAVGSFTTYNGSAVNCIVRINADGTRDTTFNVGTGIFPTSAFNSSISSTFGAFDDSGSFYLGGGLFSSYSGSAAGKVVKITPSGSVDLSFQTSGSVFNGFDAAVATILYKNN